MSHVRKQIRDAVTILLTGLTTTGDRVFAGRVTPIGQNEVPGLRLFVDEESIDAGTIHGPAVLERGLTIRVECCAALADGLDDELDQMALEVEEAIAADTTLGGILNGAIVPTSIDIDRSGEGATPIGQLTITFAAAYEVANDDVETSL
jgi:hypothetical protein